MIYRMRIYQAVPAAQRDRQSLPLLFTEKEEVFMISTTAPVNNVIDEVLHRDPYS